MDYRTHRLAVCLAFVTLIILLAPASANPYDLSNIMGTAQASLAWHVNPYLYWKFGSVYLGIEFLAIGFAHLLAGIGMSMAASLQIGAKVVSIVADAAGALALVQLTDTLSRKVQTIVMGMWLLSPAVIWVSIGDAQIETITAAFILGAIAAARVEKHAVAGLLIGLGIGFEYLPVLVAAYYIVAIVSGEVRIKQGTTVLGTTVFSVLVSFGPNMLSAVGRASLTRALLTGSGSIVGHPQALEGSVWSVAPSLGLVRAGASHWVEVFLAGAIAIILVFAMRARVLKVKAQDCAIQAVGALLLMVLIVEPSFLPQFGVLLFVGTVLLFYNEARASYIGIGAVLGLLPIVGWLLTSPIAYFFEDSYPAVFVHPTVGISTTAVSSYVAAKIDAVDVYIVVLLILFGLVKWRGFDSIKRGLLVSAWALAVGASTGLLVLFLIQGIGVAIKTGYYSNNVSALFDTSFNTTTRNANSVKVQGQSVRIEFGTLQVEALGRGAAQPKMALTFLPRTMGSVGVGGSVDGLIRLPIVGECFGSGLVKVSVWGLELLLHAPVGRQGATVASHWTEVNVDGREIAPVSARYVVGRWETVFYKLPASLVNTEVCQSIGKGLMVHLEPGVLSNASVNRVPWYRAWPEVGTWSYRRGGREYAARFTAMSPDGGIADVGGRIQSTIRLEDTGIEGISRGDVWAEFHWDNGVETIDRAVGTGWMVAGAIYGMGGVAATGWLLVKLVTRRSGA